MPPTSLAGNLGGGAPAQLRVRPDSVVVLLPGGQHEASNGLLLRRDLHSLFDAGYVTVTPDLRFEVSRRIEEEFDNGKRYYALHGQQIAAPSH